MEQQPVRPDPEVPAAGALLGLSPGPAGRAALRSRRRGRRRGRGGRGGPGAARFRRIVGRGRAGAPAALRRSDGLFPNRGPGHRGAAAAPGGGGAAGRSSLPGRHGGGGPGKHRRAGLGSGRGGAGGTIATDTLLEAHRRLAEGTPLEEHGGSLRRVQNWIGGSHYNPCSADFVPPPPDLVPGLVDDLCEFAGGDGLPALAQAAVAHAQFETIHPFVDGNDARAAC